MNQHIARAALALSSFAAGRAWAHSGHGMPGDVHWHATDVAGIAFVVAAALVAWWLSRGE